MKRLALPTSRQAGFSLVELMIAVTLGLIILAALTTFFVQTSGNRSEMERNTRQIENGRYAIDTMREDVSLAGFYADTAPLVNPAWVTNDACPGTIAAYGFAIAPAYTAPVPVFGYPDLVGVPGGCLNSLQPNHDVLVVRRFNTESNTPAEAGVAPNATRYFLQNSQCVDDDPLVPIITNTGASGAFTLRNVGCSGPARVWRMREQVYYLRSCSVCDPTPDNMPTLWRADLDPDGTYVMKHIALVEGIEAMRFEYGVDNGVPPGTVAGDGLPDVWTRCDMGSCTADTWANVTAVKVYLLARNVEETPGYSDNKTYSMGLAGTVGAFNDKYRRHVYSATIAMPNRSGPREPQLATAP